MSLRRAVTLIEVMLVLAILTSLSALAYPSVAMMLEMSFGLEAEARNVWHAMQSVFAQGNSTPDLSKPGDGVKMISTQAFGDLVAEELDRTPVPA